MAAPAPQPQPGGRGNLLTAKLGPLATWVWLLIGTVLIGAYYLYEKHKAGTGSSPAAPGTTANASQVPDIILQDYGVPVTQTVTAAPPPGSVPPPPPGGLLRRRAGPKPPRGKKPPPRKPEPPSEPIFDGSYKVRKGQTLEEVARQFGITREQLAHANGFGTGAGLREGQTLKVPSPAPGGKPNKAP
jgi:hypothetical protein